MFVCGGIVRIPPAASAPPPFSTQCCVLFIKPFFFFFFWRFLQGVCQDYTHQGEIAKLLYFESNKGQKEELSSLDEYVSR